MYMYMFSYNHYRKHVIILCFYKNLDFIISTTRYLKIGLYDVKKKTLLCYLSRSSMCKKAPSQQLRCNTCKILYEAGIFNVYF